LAAVDCSTAKAAIETVITPAPAAKRDCRTTRVEEAADDVSTLTDSAVLADLYRRDTVAS
jgi:hypothetical protein